MITKGAVKLKPLEAIKYFKSKGYEITWDWREQLAINNAQVFTVAKAMKMDILMDIRDEVQKAIDNGLTFQSFQDNLEPRLKALGWWGKQEIEGQVVQLGSPYRLRTIYETNIQSSYMAGRWKEFEDNKDDRPYMEYIAVMDDSTRPSHAALDGTIKHIDDPFWNTYMPPLGYNSFVPGCKMRGTFESGTKRLYSGEVVTIKTLQNRELTVTPNHPVPTPTGFVAAGNLRKGNNIFAYYGGIEVMFDTSPPFPAQDYQYIPAPIEKIYELIAEMGFLLRANIRSDDFYNDISGGDSNIDVVRLDRVLSHRIKSIFIDDIKNFIFEPAYPGKVSHLTLGNPEFFLERFLAPSDSSPSIPALANYGSTILFNLAPFKKFRRAPFPGDYSVFPENPADGRSAYSEYFGKLQNRFPGIIKLDEIAGISHDNFSGHVYDLQSPTGLIIANDIVISNCRCRTSALTAEQAGEKGITKGKPNVEPDPGFANNPGKDRWEPDCKDYDPDIWELGK